MSRYGCDAYHGASTLPYEHDPIAQVLVAECGPMSQEAVAAVFGVTRQAISCIELGAMRKLAGHGPAVRDMLRQLDSMRSRRTVTMPEALTRAEAAGLPEHRRPKRKRAA